MIGSWKKCYGDGSAPVSYYTDALSACPLNTASGYVYTASNACGGNPVTCGAANPVLECKLTTQRFVFIFTNFYI